MQWLLGLVTGLAAGMTIGIMVMAAFSIRSYRRGYRDGEATGRAASWATAVQRVRDAHAAKVRELDGEHLGMVVELRQLRSLNLHLRNRVRILESQETQARQAVETVRKIHDAALAEGAGVEPGRGE